MQGDAVTGVVDSATAHNWGPLDHPRAGARILLRVRIRLLDELAANYQASEWRDAVLGALGEVDYCLSLLWVKR